MSKKQKQFKIISPDGIPIHMKHTIDDNKVLSTFSKWKKRFELQGYYSSNNGRIELCDLDDWCEVIEVK